MENLIIHNTKNDKRYKLIINFENIDGTDINEKEKNELNTAIVTKLRPVFNYTID